MKIRDVKGKMNESLPPHLAKFVGDDGDWTPDAKRRLGKDGAERLATTKRKPKDVTPTGYGPDDVSENAYAGAAYDEGMEAYYAGYAASENPYQGKAFNGRFPKGRDNNGDAWLAGYRAAERGEEKIDEDVNSFVKVDKRVFYDLENRGATFNPYTGGLYMDDKLIGVRDDVTDQVGDGDRYYYDYLVSPEFAPEVAEATWPTKADRRPDHTPNNSPRIANRRVDNTPTNAPDVPMSGHNSRVFRIADLRAEYKRLTGKNAPRNLDIEEYEELVARAKGLKEGWFDDKGRYTSTGTTTYLLKDPEGTDWTLFHYEDTPGSNPRHLGKMIDQVHQRLGWRRGEVIAQWKGDIDEVLADAQNKLASGTKYIHSYQMDLERKVRDLSKAKKVMSAGKEVHPPTTEGRDPRDVINNFLKQKEQRSERGQKLYKDREAEEQRTKEVDEAEVGDKVKYRNIKTKRRKTGTVQKVDTKNGQKRYELDGGKMVYDGDLEEAGGKIACLKCDEVSTAAAWKKNNGFCPKCKTSSQGVAESAQLNEATPGLDSIGAPRELSRKIMKTLSMDSAATPKPVDKLPAVSALDNTMIVRQTNEGWHAIARVKGRGDYKYYVSFRQKNGSEEVEVKEADSIKSVQAIFGKGRSKYWAIKSTTGWVTNRRAKPDSDVDSVADRQGVGRIDGGNVWEYANRVFLPKIKDKLNAKADEIYSQIRSIPRGKDEYGSEMRSWPARKTAREAALSYAEALEDLAEKGFTRETRAHFLRNSDRYSTGGRYWDTLQNEKAFSELISAPNGRAKFAKALLDQGNYYIKQFQSLKSKFESVDESEPTDSDYAIGMAQAKKSTGDTPPLKKSTIRKAHKIAKAVAKESTASGRRMPTHEIMNRIERAMPDLKPYGVKEKVLGIVSDILYKADQGILEDSDPCWKGYRQLGMKKKNGKEVPNCVPESKEVSWEDRGYNDCKQGKPKRKFSSTANPKTQSSYWAGWKRADLENQKANSVEEGRRFKTAYGWAGGSKEPTKREIEAQRKRAEKRRAEREARSKEQSKVDEAKKVTPGRKVAKLLQSNGWDVAFVDKTKNGYSLKIFGYRFTSDNPERQKEAEARVLDEKRQLESLLSNEYPDAKVKVVKSWVGRSESERRSQRYGEYNIRVLVPFEAAPLGEAMPSFGKVITVSKGGKAVKQIKMQDGVKMHHLARELRAANLGLRDLDLTNAARELARGKPYSAGDVELTVGEHKPRQF
jgi:hypothetical protein